MRQRTFKIFPKTDSVSILRLLGEDGRLVAERELSVPAIQHLIDEVERNYRTAMPNLVDLGRRLYEWLDGPTERWLEQALKDAPGLALHVDVEERLRHLPWELLSAGGGFLCANPYRSFTPVRHVTGARLPVEPANRPLRVLFMACSPQDVSQVLDFEAEERLILDATRDRNRPIELVVDERNSNARAVRAANRYWDTPGLRSGDLGFRWARNQEEPSQPAGRSPGTAERPKK